MKKIIFSLVCMLLICSAAVAQNRGGNRNRQGGGRGFQPMAVIDTAVVNHIGLSEELLAQVYALKDAQAEEAKEQMSKMMPERGKRMNEEARAEMMEKMAAMKQGFRKQLRALIGDEMYIAYLEKALDTRNMNMMRPMQGGQGFGGQGGFGGGMPQGGGFGGGMPQGGGFGGGDF